MQIDLRSSRLLIARSVLNRSRLIVAATLSIAEIIAEMNYRSASSRHKQISSISVLVVEPQNSAPSRLIGIVTQKDIIAVATQAINLFEVRIADVMTKFMLSQPFPQTRHPPFEQLQQDQWNVVVQKLYQQTHDRTIVLAAVRQKLGQPCPESGCERIEAERKATAAQLHRQAALLDVATDAIVLQDLESTVLYWNRGAEVLYGWSAADAIGQKTSQLFDQSNNLETVQQQVIEQGEWSGELQQITKTQRTVIVSSRWTLVRDEAEQPQSILVVNTNITEKKQLEAQFLRTQRLESLGTLASGIAHDLNNILTPILTVSQLLPLKLKDLDDYHWRLLKLLETNAHRGAELVKQILSFAKGTESRRLPLQVAHLLTEIVQMGRQTFPKLINVTLNLATTNLWLVPGDATQLHQVLMNLVVNARDAMPNGGTLTVSAENLWIDGVFAQMHLEAQIGAYVVITVADTGEGIAPEFIDRIFDPFFTTKEPGKGTGLGLSTVIGIVKNHGGFVQVNSEIGEGTQFKVFLPAIQQTAAEHSLPLTEIQGQGELILVVEDEVGVQEIARCALEAHQFRTIIAQNGVEAIALYGQHQTAISAVLLDMMMPTLDGATTIRALHSLNPKLPIVAISGLITNQQTAQQLGATSFLAKPFTLNDLLRSIKIALTSIEQ
ncbi:ATP-binding protein [Leptolyngbya sp. AN03gr2]|uniref:ATP-binding protein n=1 Tax=unclassified Leptolyngbya TaxID=2650499 RepID=UPI003D319D30